MRILFLCLSICLFSFSSKLKAQSYFPPISSNSWDSLAPSQMNWDLDYIDSLYQFLDSNNTKAFILLKDGKIVMEKYFNGHNASANWYWASAGKSLTAFTLGIAQSENHLNIEDTSSNYLGPGWTSSTSSQEQKIKIRDQLSMTTGLDDGVFDPFCTIDSCLIYAADAGTRWAYHNGPYTLLDTLLEVATGQSLNSYTQQKLLSPTGMNGLYVKLGFNNVFFSTARSMARFGLLALNEGIWDSNPILDDSLYFQEMTNSTQSLNLAYGFLWWLNGKSSFRIPQSQIQFQGSICPDAPSDMYAALGKNGQLINVVPSQNLVWIRMGDAPDNSLVPFILNNEIWQYLNQIQGSDLSSSSNSLKDFEVDFFPNPVHSVLSLNLNKAQGSICKFKVYDAFGKLQKSGSLDSSTGHINCENLPKGFYTLQLILKDQIQTLKFLKA